MVTDGELTLVTVPRGSMRWVQEMFVALDAGDISRFLSYLTPDVRFRLGDRPAFHGYEQLRPGLTHFVTLFTSTRHALTGLWQDGNSVIVEAEASYTRLDGQDVCVPVVHLLRLRAPEKIADYRIFHDLAPVFA